MRGARSTALHPHMSSLHDPWMDAVSRQIAQAIPATNLLGAWEATSTGTGGAGGTLSLNDLSGNGKNITSTSSTNPLALTVNDPLCGGTTTVHATLANNGGVATMAAFSAPFTLYIIGYTTVSNGDFVTLGATMLRLFTGLSGTAETWTWRVPSAGNQISDAHGANTSAILVMATIPISAGTFNSYVSQSTPATASGTAGVIPAAQTAVTFLSGNLGANIFGMYLYNGSDSQATRLATGKALLTRANLPTITT